MSLTAGSLQPRATRAGVLSHSVLPAGLAGLLTAIVAAFVASWPLGLTNDYLNHLARTAIEARLHTDAALQQFYALSFAVIPDLTMDMTIPWLAPLIGIEAAGGILIWIAIVAPPLAGLFLARTLHRRITGLSLIGFVALFNENIQWGFVNFSISMALALVGFTLWIRMLSSGRRTLLFAPFGLFLALNHALGFLVFGYLVLMWEIASFMQRERGTTRAFLTRLTIFDGVAMAPGLLLLLASASNGAGELPQFGMTDFALLPKLTALWSGALFFTPFIAYAVTIAVALLVYGGLRSGFLAIDRKMVWVCGGLLALVLLMPTSIFGIWGLHFRYPSLLIIVAAASLTFGDDIAARVKRLVYGMTGALVVLVLANGALHMARIDGETRDLRTVLKALPVGAKLLTARDEEADLAFAPHSAGLAVIDRSAYVPNLFTNTSPVDVLPSMRALHMPQSMPLLESELADGANRALPGAQNGHWSPTYYYGWPDHWDYLLFFRGSPTSELKMNGICPVSAGETAILYRIVDVDTDCR
ncbi:MAG: hypothetical protein AAGF59_09980 [Pseudomonadota bacterium]